MTHASTEFYEILNELKKENTATFFDSSFFLKKKQNENKKRKRFFISLNENINSFLFSVNQTEGTQFQSVLENLLESPLQKSSSSKIFELEILQLIFYFLFFTERKKEDRVQFFSKIFQESDEHPKIVLTDQQKKRQKILRFGFLISVFYCFSNLHNLEKLEKDMEKLKLLKLENTSIEKEESKKPEKNLIFEEKFQAFPEFFSNCGVITEISEENEGNNEFDQSLGSFSKISSCFQILEFCFHIFSESKNEIFANEKGMSTGPTRILVQAADTFMIVYFQMISFFSHLRNEKQAQEKEFFEFFRKNSQNFENLVFNFESILMAIENWNVLSSTTSTSSSSVSRLCFSESLDTIVQFLKPILEIIQKNKQLIKNKKFIEAANEEKERSEKEGMEDGKHEKSDLFQMYDKEQFLNFQFFWSFSSKFVPFLIENNGITINSSTLSNIGKHLFLILEEIKQLQDLSSQNSKDLKENEANDNKTIYFLIITGLVIGKFNSKTKFQILTLSAAQSFEDASKSKELENMVLCQAVLDAVVLSMLSKNDKIRNLSLILFQEAVFVMMELKTEKNSNVENSALEKSMMIQDMVVPILLNLLEQESFEITNPKNEENEEKASKSTKTLAKLIAIFGRNCPTKILNPLLSKISMSAATDEQEDADFNIKERKKSENSQFLSNSMLVLKELFIYSSQNFLKNEKNEIFSMLANFLLENFEKGNENLVLRLDSASLFGKIPFFNAKDENDDENEDFFWIFKKLMIMHFSRNEKTRSSASLTIKKMIQFNLYENISKMESIHEKKKWFLKFFFLICRIAKENIRIKLKKTQENDNNDEEQIEIEILGKQEQTSELTKNFNSPKDFAQKFHNSENENKKESKTGNENSILEILNRAFSNTIIYSIWNFEVEDVSKISSFQKRIPLEILLDLASILLKTENGQSEPEASSIAKTLKNEEKKIAIVNFMKKMFNSLEIQLKDTEKGEKIDKLFVQELENFFWKIVDEIIPNFFDNLPIFSSEIKNFPENFEKFILMCLNPLLILQMLPNSLFRMLPKMKNNGNEEKSQKTVKILTKVIFDLDDSLQNKKISLNERESLKFLKKLSCEIVSRFPLSFYSEEIIKNLNISATGDQIQLLSNPELMHFYQNEKTKASLFLLRSYLANISVKSEAEPCFLDFFHKIVEILLKISKISFMISRESKNNTKISQFSGIVENFQMGIMECLSLILKIEVDKEHNIGLLEKLLNFIQNFPSSAKIQEKGEIVDAFFPEFSIFATNVIINSISSKASIVLNTISLKSALNLAPSLIPVINFEIEKILSSKDFKFVIFSSKFGQDSEFETNFLNELKFKFLLSLEQLIFNLIMKLKAAIHPFTEKILHIINISLKFRVNLSKPKLENKDLNLEFENLYKNLENELKLQSMKIFTALINAREDIAEDFGKNFEEILKQIDMLSQIHESPEVLNLARTITGLFSRINTMGPEITRREDDDS